MAKRSINITIVSGGQTGADRAALDVAIECGLAHGGWCPKGRNAEDGVVPERYLLKETPEQAYAQRTEWNVRDSDATVLLTLDPEPQGGSRLTLALARHYTKPHLCLHPSMPAVSCRLVAFVRDHSVSVLNVAGSRESEEPGIYQFASGVLREAMQTLDNCS